MTYRLLPDVALADIAFEAESKTIDGLFSVSGKALTDIMVESKGVRTSETRTITLEGETLDRMLYDFLTELIVLKDVDSLLFKEFRVKVAKDERSLKAVLKGEKIDRGRHSLRNDVKAVTMHLFGVSHSKGKWKATIVLDI